MRNPLQTAQLLEKAEIKVVITTYDSCLVAYPWPDWLKLEEQFTKITNPSSNVRAFRRLFIGGAEEQTLDAQGRIRLSQEHREYARLDKEITILGLTNRFEIWNPVLLKQSMEEINFNAMWQISPSRAIEKLKSDVLSIRRIGEAMGVVREEDSDEW